MKLACALGLIALAFLPLVPSASADEVACVLKRTETDYYCVELVESPWGDALCVMHWNAQGTYGEGHCVLLEPMQ